LPPCRRRGSRTKFAPIHLRNPTRQNERHHFGGVGIDPLNAARRHDENVSGEPVRLRHVRGHVVLDAELRERLGRQEREDFHLSIAAHRHEHRLVEPPLLADEGVEHVLGGRIHEAHEREPVEHIVQNADEAARDQVRREEPDERDDHQRHEKAGAGNRQPQPTVDRREDDDAHVHREGQRPHDHEPTQEIVEESAHRR